MKKQLLSLTIIAGMVASASAATILTDFSTTVAHAGGNANLATVGATVAVSGDDTLVTHGGVFTASLNDLRYKGDNGEGALGLTVSLNKNNNTPSISGSFNVNYTIGASNVQISAITLKSGIFDGGNGSFKASNAAAMFTLAFTSTDGTELATWTGNQIYVSNSTGMKEAILTGETFTLAAGSTVNLKIQVDKATTGSTTDAGFIGIDSVSMEATAVPEPATAGLGLLGLGALMLRRRRK